MVALRLALTLAATAGRALGLVVNLPMGDARFARALEPRGLDVPPGRGKVRVDYGGTVES